MPRLTRRTLLLGLAGALGTAACAPVAATSIRGTGTVLRSGEPPRPTSNPTPPSVEPTAAPTGTGALAPAEVPPAVPDPPATGPTPAPGRPEPEAGAPLARSVAPPGDALAAQARLMPVPRATPPPAIGLPPTWLITPTIGVDSKVVALGTTIDRTGELVWERPVFAVGWYKPTGLPGQPGNMVLSGHISSPNEGAVFKRLPELKVGEGVIVATDDRQYLYRVSDIQVVPPERVSVMAPTREPIATLITCVPDGIYTDRLIVAATLV